MKKYITSYSNSKRIKLQDDVIDLRNKNYKSDYYDLRYKNFMYNIDDNLLHKVFYYDKKQKFSSFYFDKFKQISYEDLNNLPFDTDNFITYEVIGHSIFAVSNNRKIFLFNKYGKCDNSLSDYVDIDYKFKYLINKYNEYIFEFKLFNDELYLINIFNNDKIQSYNFIKNVSDVHDLKIPKLVNSNLYKYGSNMMDMFYNDYYLNEDIYIKNRNYYLTFIFHNNKYLLYKL